MPHSESKIKTDIKAYVRKEAGPYKSWYIGVTNDPERRLFVEHGVQKENGWWIYRGATSAAVARKVEEHFINLGMDGAPGGGDEKSDVVYAYKKTSRTKP
ncbi:hypothetical protein E3J62_03170 [candidate division TA06 bacterium]|uniref:Uncharacterized protein n=1 Tax=candidate division TA06 bacterium TaxID=2250710 RepID=A0A523UW46_UNCT6|nr:MAG: hypothetical protein E3J62_03170 [candidate division TA06 bacterium]